jgi:hypothetical protein
VGKAPGGGDGAGAQGGEQGEATRGPCDHGRSHGAVGSALLLLLSHEQERSSIANTTKVIAGGLLREQSSTRVMALPATRPARRVTCEGIDFEAPGARGAALVYYILVRTLC